MLEHVGQQLGHYRLLRLLGEGSFATVYLGHPLHGETQVAIKVLNWQLASEEVEPFRREAARIARLTHPYLVRVLDFGVQGSTAFLVMEYASNGTLRQRHPVGSRVDLATVVSYVQQIAPALQYAHEQHLLHGNLKPENLLVGSDQQVLLCDCGMVSLLQELPSSPSLEAIGTATYLSPEQIQGKFHSASDQYALAILVYEWLTGQPPFHGSFAELSAQHLFSTPASLHEQLPALPAAVEQVVLTALAKDRRQRFASVQDFANAFAQASAISVETSLPVRQPLSSTAPMYAPSFVPLLLEAPILVGRQREWTQLEQLWQRTVRGGPHLVVLAGEAGVGKTRLAEELFGWVAQQGTSVARASCYAVEGTQAYAPVGIWLRAEAVRSRLERLSVLWLSEVARFVPDLLVERPSLPPPGPLSESWQQQRLFEALAHAILAARQPLLLLLDDLQWCDRETLNWLHYLLRFDTQAHLLIVATLRSEELTSGHPLQSFLTTLQREGHLSQLNLDRLSASETATLAGQLAGQTLDPGLLSRLYQETEGNALFVVETVRMGFGVAGKGEQEDSELGKVGSTEEAWLPPTIQAVIVARLEQLSAEAREVVSVTAVIGRPFSFDLLAQVSKREEEALLEDLDELWKRRVIREEGKEGYNFTHGKIREVAYAEVRPPRRRLLHRRVAEALEALHAERLDALSGDIASHYEQAGMVDRAVTYYQRAAEVARQLYANADAIALYRRALALWEGASTIEAKSETITRLYEQVADILTLTSQYDEAKAAYENALAQMPRDDRVWQARLYRKIGWIAGWNEESSLYYVQEFQYYDRAETLLGPEPIEPASLWWEEWIQIQLFRMRTYYNWAKLPELEELVEKVRPLVEQYGTPRQRAEFLFRLALAGYLRECYVPSDETLHYQLGALTAIQESEDLNAISEHRFALGFCYLWRNELEKAEEQLQTALDSAKRVGALVLQSRCLTYLTITYRKRGEVDKVRKYALQALAIATRVQHTGYIAMARGNMAWVGWREGDMAEAQKHGQAGLEAFDGAGEPFEWLALWPLIGVAAVQQQLADAMKYVRMLLVPGQQRLPDALTVVLEQAIQAWDSHQPETAGSHLQQATVLAQEMGYL